MNRRILNHLLHRSRFAQPHRMLTIGFKLLVLVLIGLMLADSVKGQTSEVETPHMLDDSQLVFSEAQYNFDVKVFLEDHHSPLTPHAGDIELAAAIASVNPKVILTFLEMEARLVTSNERMPAQPLFQVDGMSQFQHLPAIVRDVIYLTGVLVNTFDTVRFAKEGISASGENPYQIKDLNGQIIQASSNTNAADMALLRVTALRHSVQELTLLSDPSNPEGFQATYQRLFGEDPTQSLFEVPSILSKPPDGLLYFPFKQGERARLTGGPHPWCGAYSSTCHVTLPRSSIDLQPYPNTTGPVSSAAGGTVVRADGDQGTVPCLVRLSHSEDWETQYYHLTNVSVSQWQEVGPHHTLGNSGTALCWGGSATGPHVHFSLLSNGAHIVIDGTKLSGWTVRAAASNYDGWLEKDSSVINKNQIFTVDHSDVPPPVPKCPSSGGVILYKHAGYDCGGEGKNYGYVLRSSTDWQNMPASFNDQASSLRVPSGWSVRLYEHFNLGGASVCRNSNDENFSGDFFNNGGALNDNVSSFRVFDSPSCGGTTTFADVSIDYWAHDEIEALYRAGFTAGCSTAPLMYCPENDLNRAEMAVFLVRAIHGADYTPPPVAQSSFTDVPSEHWAIEWIEQLYNDGMTAGCNPDPLQYCPDSSMTRAEMAVFMVRVKHGADFTPPNVQESSFEDVPPDHWAIEWIEQMYQDKLTGGCQTNPLRYCPEREMKRSEMAVFLVRALGLPLPGEGGGGPPKPETPGSRLFLPLVLK